MYKIYTKIVYAIPRCVLKSLFTTKSAVFLLVVTMLQASAAYGQRVTFEQKNVTLDKVFNEVRKQTGYSVLFATEELKGSMKVDVDFNKASLEEVLDKLILKKNLTYSIEEKVIIVKKKARSLTDPPGDVTPSGKITGKVTNAEGNPMAGVSVMVKGAPRAFGRSGSQTNSEGRYTISAHSGDVLSFSFIGFKKKEVNVGQGASLNITMDEETATLEKVVVVGYGETRKKDLTGSVSSIDVSALKNANSPNFDVALVGLAPGVLVVKTNGAPGADASIRVRGGTSVLGVNEPLYVIDGIPVQIGGQGSAAYANDRSTLYQPSPLAYINPDDIESIDILKDASSTAIYGSRAANGVVIVTTKRGKKGQQPSLNVSYTSNFEDFTERFKMLNTTQFISVVNEAYANIGRTPPDYKPNKDVYTNWDKEATQVSRSDNWNVSLNGGTPNSKTIYSFTAGMSDRKGVIMNSEFKRYNLGTNLETEVFSKLKIGSNIKYSQANNKGLGNNFYYNIVKYRPDIPVYDEKGNYATTPDSASSNPYAQLKQIAQSASKNLMASVYGEFELVSGLKLRSALSYNITDGSYLRYIPSWDAFEARNRRTGTRRDNMTSFSSRVFDNTITYNKVFQKHYINTVAGASFLQEKSNFTRLSSTNFPNDDVLNNLGSAAGIDTYTSGGGISGLESYFLRSNYNYDSRYYVTFTGRADRSTKFGPNNQWGVFPSAALAWRISRENFLKQYKFINDIKLRVSAGRTGSANFGDFLYATFFTTGSFYNGSNGITPNSVPNPDIKWETTDQLDAGIDFSFFNNRLRGMVNYYEKLTKGLILTMDIPYETGASSQLTNIGNVFNRGLEMQLGGDIVNSKNFIWSTDVNISFNRNVLKKLNNGSLPNGTRLVEGEPLSYFYGYKSAGLFQTQEEIDKLNAASPSKRYQETRTGPGDIKFVDTNNDGQVTPDDMVKIGNAEPRFFGGWNHMFRYKGLTLSALFNFSAGHVLYNSSYAGLSLFNSERNNYTTDILNAWTPENTNTDVPRNVFGNPNLNGRISDYYVSSASFFRLKNIHLSYVLNHAWLNKAYINNIRLFVSASNVFTITRYKGLDPEVNNNPANPVNQGLDNSAYPQTRSFSTGINIGF